MIAHLKDRAAALAALGWTGQDAEWLAFVCLHSGAFLRSQYLAFTGASHPMHASRFIARCGAIAVEERWNGTALRLCRIVSRPVYRALGAEHIRHRRDASAALLLRRVLALDYLVDHRDGPWLATETEKVAALTAAGVPEAVLPRRVYAGKGTNTQQTRYFVNKLPMALDATHGTFVFVQGTDATPSALDTWGASHAAVWEALRAAGRAVTVVVVGRDRSPLETAQHVLARWAVGRPMSAPTADEAAELDTLRAAVADTNAATLRRLGGLPTALRRIVTLEDRMQARPAGASNGAGARIVDGSVWRSKRVRA